MSGANPSSTPSSTTSSGDDDAYLKKSQGRGRNTVIIAVLLVIIIALAGVAGAYATGLIGKKSTTSTSTGTGNGNNKTTPTEPTWYPECGGAITAGGSTFVYPLQALWTTDFAGQKCNTTGANGASATDINYQAVGSGTGVTDLTDGLFAFGASDAPLTTTQTNALKSPVVTMPDSAGAVTVIYNLKVTNTSTGKTTPLRLTGAVIEQIYNGTITNWNVTQITSLNPGTTVPSQTITVEHRSDGSGTSFAFTTFLSDASPYWASHVGASTTPNWPVGIGDHGSEGVAGAVATTTGSIGYDELNYAEEEGTALEIAEVQNPAGNYILPSVADTAYAVNNASNIPSPTGSWQNYSLENGAGAGTYPIVTLTYLMIYTDIGKAPAYSGSYTQAEATSIVDYLWWIVHQGQNDSAGLFYVPLPAVIIAEDVAAIGDIQFNGATLTSHAPAGWQSSD